jgi:hypothetical protein
MSGDREAIARLPMPDLEKIIVATLTGMTTDQFNAEVAKWLSSAKDPRWKKPYTELTYLPMIELLSFLREHGYKTYIVTGFGQDFVRVYSQKVYGITPDQVVGSALATEYGYAKDGTPQLIKVPKLMLNDKHAGKPEGIHLMIGQRPHGRVRQFDRRSTDARVRGGRRRCPIVDAGAARRRKARVCVWPRNRTSGFEDRHVDASAL